ncbi:hypothetical protein COO60DRAFT_1462279 [Scenedesmus sp. NREL 46B-D3]|nr:hypothetical protein COO60DRAFT_1462279 [Scenedesmus sp. NREL 46B-D3]
MPVITWVIIRFAVVAALLLLALGHIIKRGSAEPLCCLFGVWQGNGAAGWSGPWGKIDDVEQPVLTCTSPVPSPDGVTLQGPQHPAAPCYMVPRPFTYSMAPTPPSSTCASLASLWSIWSAATRWTQQAAALSVSVVWLVLAGVLQALLLAWVLRLYINNKVQRCWNTKLMNELYAVMKLTKPKPVVRSRGWGLLGSLSRHATPYWRRVFAGDNEMGEAMVAMHDDDDDWAPFSFNGF